MKCWREGEILLVATAVAVAVVWLSLRETGGRSDAPAPVRVRLANRIVETVGFRDAESTNQTASVRGTRPYVLVTKGRADKTLRLAAEAAGARVIGPYPPQAFLAECDAQSLRRLAKDARFAGAAEFLPTDKVDPRLKKALDGGAATVDATVVALAPSDKSLLDAVVASDGGEKLKGCLCGPDSFKARLPATLVATLARRGDVRWMEPFVRPKLMNDLAVEPAAMNVRPAWNTHGLTGAGQVVSTSDTGIDTGNVKTMHRDLADRIAGIRSAYFLCSTKDGNGHGTHTAGSIVGNGTMSDGAIRGTAYGARLWAWCCEGSDGNLYTPETEEDLFRPDQWKTPKYIHSASWGSPTNGTYDVDCALVDAFVWSTPDFLPVFACGNEGSGARTIGSPAGAKNLLAVGATQNLRTSPSMGWADGNPTVTASYSSRGPCADGRIKPDIAAPGTGILSTRAYACPYKDFGICTNENYAYNCGTSMATPLTAGAVALVREWLVDRRGFTNAMPSAALMKAVITGGAKGRTVPDNKQGWGRVDLEETLYPSNRVVKLVDRIPFAVGQAFTYEIETTNAAPLDVQLVWIDVPGTEGGDPSAPRLVNDLDLSVCAAIGDAPKVWHGNGGAEPDRLNTLESVRIASAPPTKYEISVTCRSIFKDHTEGGAAALYIRGAFAEEPDESMVILKVGADFPDGETTGSSPETGTWKYPKGSVVSVAFGEAYGTNGYGTIVSRHGCAGYVGTGSVPASGPETVLDVVVNEDSTITWQVAQDPWAYLLTFCTMNPVESYNPFWDAWGQTYLNYEYTDAFWIGTNEEVFVSIPEHLPYGDSHQCYCYTRTFRQWKQSGPYLMKLGEIGLGTTDEADGIQYDEKNRMVRSLTFKMDGPKDLWAYYYDAATTVDGTLPVWWYARFLYGSYANGAITEDESYFEGDPDGDGFKNDAEYADGTDPVDDASFPFKVTSFSPTNMAFTGSIKGKLIVETCDRLGGEWKGVLTNAQTRTSTQNDVSLPENSTNAFYRVRHCAD